MQALSDPLKAIAFFGPVKMDAFERGGDIDRDYV